MTRVIPGLSQNRQIVQWTFNEDREEGDINVFSTNEAHIVVILKEMFEDGVQPLEKVEEDVRAKVILEKKADMFSEKINEAKANASTMAEIASALNKEVKPQATSFASSALSGIGSEPKVVGTMIGLQPGTISGPVVGERGVYVVASREMLPSLLKRTMKQKRARSNHRSETLSLHKYLRPSRKTPTLTIYTIRSTRRL